MGQSLNYRIIKKTNNTGSSGRGAIKVIICGGGKGRREGGVGLDAEGRQGQGRGNTRAASGDSWLLGSGRATKGVLALKNMTQSRK